jgi:hypothetical protein
VHHLLPGLEGQAKMLADLVCLDMDVCLGPQSDDWKMTLTLENKGAIRWE